MNPHAAAAEALQPALTDPKYRGLSKFELQNEIGKGCFSAVFKARCKEDGSYVALKKVKVTDLVDDKAQVDCMKEMALLQRLDHPNIIKYYASFLEDGALHIVLELADGGDLAKVIKTFRDQGKLVPEKTIWKYMVQVCSAVLHMHRKRIMHRDIKPANVFVTKEGFVKLGDLGLGRFFSAKTVAAHSLVGTPYYMSPERIQEQEYDFKSDVWSVGCLIYEMASLQSPFHCDKKNIFSLLKKIVMSDYPPIPANMYSDELRGLVAVCVDPEPAKRRDIGYANRVATEMNQRFSSDAR